MSKLAAIVFGCVCAVLCQFAQAQAVPVWQDYSERIKPKTEIAQLGVDLFGDKVSMYIGSIEFANADVSLAGNNTLPVSVGRRFTVQDRSKSAGLYPGLFGDWDIEIPHLHGVFPATVGANTTGWQVSTSGLPDKRCSVDRNNFWLATPPVANGSNSGLFSSAEYWYGNYLYVPGAGDKKMMVVAPENTVRPTDGSEYYWTTSDRWFFSCQTTTANGVPGEAFVAVSPDGEKYYFDWFVKRPYQSLEKPVTICSIPQPACNTVLNRNEVWILPTRVVDRFGNTVTYSYDQTDPRRLKTISSSDGRVISINYGANGKISSVVADGKTWSYTYDAVGGLIKVELPDLSSWQLNFDAVVHAFTGNSLHSDCVDPPTFTGQSSTATLVHPSGAVGTFAFSARRNGRSYVPRSCVFLIGGASYAAESNAIDGFSIDSRTIGGPGVPASMQWLFTYGPVNRSFAQDCASTSCPTTKQVTIALPDGSWEKYTFSNKYDTAEGRLLSLEKGIGAVANRTESISYLSDSSGQPYPSKIGNLPCNRCDNDGEIYLPTKSTVITQQGADFSSVVNTFDQFASPLSVTSSNTLGYSRTDIAAYYSNTAKWVIGRLASSANSNTGLIESKIDYWPDTVLPQRTWVFGKSHQYFTYNTDGTMASVADGNNHTTSFSNWKRGIPQTIAFADGTSKSAQVNDPGQIVSVTDEVGAKTCYGYDAMDRINRITRPSEVVGGACNQDNWLETTITFAPATATPYGLPNGHWRRTESTGTARKITYYDAFWRPMVQEVYDTADTWGTITQTINRYDAQGRMVFASYPQRVADSAVYTTWANPAVAPNALGTWTAYDALGRPTQIQQNSELGLLNTTYEYLTGFQTRVTNPRGYQTVMQYQVYDRPVTDAPSGITTFAGGDTAATEIQRNIFGKPTQLKRRNGDGSISDSRYYVYDAHQRLCKRIDKESDATIMGYDAADKLTYIASGLLQPSITDCNQAEAWNSGRRSDRLYDVRNRLTDMSFPGGNGNQHWTYTADGLPNEITTWNDEGTTTVVNAYAYNKRRLLVSENLTQPGMPTWGLGYGYSSSGAMSSITYPSGATVAYAPNALGQPTKAGSYATGVSYFANGSMKQFTYGNGIVHTMVQNARQLPERSLDSGGVLDDSYDYDANGNVAGISDGLAGGRGNRDMVYDGLDRLKTATSPMFIGGAAYAYDALDNLTRVTAPGRDHYYCYDLRWRLTNVKTGSCNGTTVVGMGYDVQGNLANKNGMLYQFDYGNRLRKVSNSVSALLEAYRYDGYGHRIWAHADQGDIYSLYGQDRVLRYQRDERKSEAYDYITLNGSLVARVTDPNSVIGVPALTAPASSTNGAYTVQWTAVPSATQYQLEETFNGSPWQPAYAGTGTSLPLSGKPAGNYAYRVRACKNTPCGGWSATATVLVNLAPAAAPNLNVPAVAPNGNYTVTWDAVPGATSYILDESANGGAWTQAYNGAGGSQAYSAKPAGTYAYRVKACNAVGCSGVSATGTTQAIYTPGAPTVSVPASSYDGNYTVSWAAVSGATSYQLEENAGGTWTLVQNSSATSKAYTGKADGNYSYRAKACNAAGCSAVSATVGIQVLTPPNASPVVSAPANNYTGSYTVTWTGVAKATSYTLHVSLFGNPGTNIYSGPAGSYAISGQGEGTYYYYVLACNAAGCSNWSAPATTQVQFIPAMPADLNGETLLIEGTRPPRFSISVYWSASPGATYYELRRGTGVVYSGSATNWSSVGTTGQDYTVRACSPGGCSAWKGPINL